jgi:two-component system chemotaxis response regulator CheB
LSAGPVVRVLLAEDSAVTRDYLRYVLDEAPGFDVVGTARDGVEAVEATQRLKPDVILLDVHMPRMSGYEAAAAIMERVPRPIVMMSASLASDEIGATFQALKAGALAVIHKPAGLGHPEQGAMVDNLLTTLRLMSEVKVVRRWSRRAPAMPPMPRRAAHRIRIVGIGASTGGPAVLGQILETLPGDLPVPILVVQHITPGFVPGLVSWLDAQTQLAVELACADAVVRPGRVYVAPDGYQMGITRDGRTQLLNLPPLEGFLPSATYLLASLADAYGAAGMGIVLTGMGKDGVAGLKRLRQARGTTVAQDEESSVVFGMPGEAARAGAAEYVLSPDEIAALIVASTGPA